MRLILQALVAIVSILPAATAAIGPVRAEVPLPDVASCASFACRPSGDVPPAFRAICAHPETRVTHDALARAGRLIAARGTPQDGATFAEGDAAYQAKLAACMAKDDRARDTCLGRALSSRLAAAEQMTDGLPSFPCAKPANTIERAICADPELARGDREIAARYDSLPKVMGRDAAAAFRADQKAWLGRRNACLTDESGDLHACLLRSQRDRLVVLQTLGGQQTLEFEAAVAEVATDPTAAAVAMRRFAEAGRPLADAWLVYLARYAPASGVGEAEAARSLDRATAAAVASDPRNSRWIAAIGRPDSEAEPGAPTGVLLLLRLLLDEVPVDDPDAEPDRPYCFIFSRHLAAYAAFGSVPGSSLDGSTRAQCAPLRGFFEQPGWYRLQAGFAAALRTAEAEGGVDRRVGWGVETLKATDLPSAFLDEPDTLEASRRVLRDWRGKIAWSRGDRERVLWAIDPAIRESARWLADQRRLPRDQAERAAERIVAVWVAARLGFIQDQNPG